MNTPFIRNHQFNLINKQVRLLQNACNTVSDPKVVEAVRFSCMQKIMEAFPEATEQEKQLLEPLATLHKTEEFQHYLKSLHPYLLQFESVTDKQLKKLFPKIKKLKLPELESIDYRAITYLGWTDYATNKLFLAYYLDGQLVGVEGKYSPLAKKNTCFLCHRHAEVALFSAITKSKPAGASPDYYKSIGNYMCIDSNTCNQHLTDPAALERFIRTIVK